MDHEENKAVEVNLGYQRLLQKIAARLDRVRNDYLVEQNSFEFWASDSVVLSTELAQGVVQKLVKSNRFNYRRLANEVDELYQALWDLGFCEIEESETK